MKNKIKPALVRALHTGVQAATPMIIMTSTIYEIEWYKVLVVAGGAMLMSLLKSLSISMPEVELQQCVNELMVDGEDFG